MPDLRAAAFQALEALEGVNGDYGNGLGVANFHQNGDLEPLDRFIESYGVGEAIDALKEALGYECPCPPCSSSPSGEDDAP